MPTIEVNPTADITVQYINEPKPGKKMGSVKDASGQYYNVFPNMLPQFSKGMRCKVEYSAEPKADGGEWRTIKKIVGNQSAPTPGPKNDYRARSNPAEAKQIAVLALAKPCIEKLAFEQLNEASLVAILNMCSRAYDKTLGGVQAQQRDDMDDSIGF